MGHFVFVWTECEEALTTLGSTHQELVDPAIFCSRVPSLSKWVV